MNIRLGKHSSSGQPIGINSENLRTHLHLIGATGSGKTSAIHVILRQLMLQRGRDRSCIFVFDPLGNLAKDLLRIMAYERYSPQSVRDRLVYIEPANSQSISTFNPLIHTDEANRYYQTMRAVELVLRAWDAQDPAQQPRLLQWMTNAFISAAMVGFPISICRFLIHPGTPEHDAIVNRLPEETAQRWKQILRSGGSEAMRILESTRNRLDPFFRSPNLKLMFGVPESRFDCEELIRERKIVIINLAEKDKIPGFICDTIGSLYLNEIFQTANRLAVTEGVAAVNPTYLFLDEFHRYVSRDVERALPTVRQMGLRMAFAHQSFAQLEREEVDLSQMIWQARTRLAFANYADDADFLADKLGKLTYDDMEIKDKRMTKRQLVDGFTRETTHSHSDTSGFSDSKGESRGENDGTHSGFNYVSGSFSPTSSSRGSSSGESQGRSESSASSASSTRTTSEQLVPNHVTFEEIASLTYRSFDEHSIRWNQRIQSLGPGEAFLQQPGSRDVAPIQMEFLRVPDSKAIDDKVEAMLEKNFSSPYFISMENAERQHEACINNLLSGKPIYVGAEPSHSEPSEAPDDNGPFKL